MSHTNPVKGRSGVSEPAVSYRSSSAPLHHIKTHLRPVLSNSIKKTESELTSVEKMKVTREGISKQELEKLKDITGLDYDQLATILGVARATLINKKGEEKFPSSLSEKVMALAEIYSFGYKVFGDASAFNKWIFEPVGALGGKSPFDFLDNQFGREEVKNIIGRIAYGIVS